MHAHGRFDTKPAADLFRPGFPPSSKSKMGAVMTLGQTQRRMESLRERKREEKTEKRA